MSTRITRRRRARDSRSPFASTLTSPRVANRIVDNVRVDEEASRHRTATLLIRAAPPALACLAEAGGTDADTVIAREPRPGAGTSAMHRFTLHNRDNTSTGS